MIAAVAHPVLMHDDIDTPMQAGFDAPNARGRPD
jgi:hypothetical protein